jgi:ABC-2 type transport system ATP-binding protein
MAESTGIEESNLSKERADPAWLSGRAEPIIETRGLSKVFDDVRAVSDINLSIPRGAIFGFIGPSGCGKTTTMRLLLGIAEATEGEATIFGKRPEQFRPEDRERIGYMPQMFVLYPDLSVRENLNFAASLYGVPFRRKDRISRLLELVELTEHQGKLAREISGGMQRRLSLAAAMMHDPDILFLDEPTAGIDPVLRRKFWDYFRGLQDAGHTFFITTQYVGEAAYCDYVGVMAEGRLLMVETPEGLRRRALGGEVIELRPARYLGYNELMELRKHEIVKDGRVSVTDGSGLRIVVEDDDAALPVLMSWFQDRQIEVESAGQYNPPFDDIFVALVEAETARLKEISEAADV